MRSFVAIDIDNDIKNIYSNLCRDIRKAAVLNIVNQNKFHITLSFFNNLTIDNVEKVKIALTSLRLEPIEIRLDSLSMFKRRGEPSIIYINSKSDKLSSFVNAYRKNLKKFNINFDEKPFKSHITIARIKEIKDVELFEKMYNKTCAFFEKQSFFASSITLYESDTLKYKPIFNISLNELTSC